MSPCCCSIVSLFLQVFAFVDFRVDYSCVFALLSCFLDPYFFFFNKAVFGSSSDP